MKKLLTLSAVVLFTSIPTMAAYSARANASQFHMPSRGKAARTTPPHPAFGGITTQSFPLHPARGSKPAAVRAAHSKGSVTATANFVTAPLIPAGGKPNWGAFDADVNGDGKMDIVGVVENIVGDIQIAQVSVALSNGDGTFQAPVLTTLPNSDPILVGDLNGDGKADIIQFHPNAGSTFDVWIADSNGDGAFTHAAQGANYLVSSAALMGGVLTDMNGDGKLDVLLIDTSNPGVVWTFPGNGDGTFQNSTTTTLAGQTPDQLVFADFNGDGKVDFAGLNYSTERPDIYLQTANGFVQKGTDLITPDAVYDSCSLAAGDLTGDGKAELIAPNCSDENITIFVNNGDGSFQTGVYYFTASIPANTLVNTNPTAAMVADVNGDGKADIVLSNASSGDVTVLAGNGDGTVTLPTVGFAVSGHPQFPALVADFNGDGLPDLVVPDVEYGYAYLEGYGDATFRSALNYYAAGSASGINIATGDFNGDGNPDFVLSSCCSGIAVFLSRADGSLLPAVQYGTGALVDVALADFNGDGHLDIAVVDQTNFRVDLYLGVADGTFTVGGTSFADTNESQPSSIVAGDFNHDGKMDLAVLNQSTNDVGILLGDGAGNFAAPTNYLLSQPGGTLTAADVNGDGYLDLLVPLFVSPGNGVALFLGKSDNTGTFNAETDVAAGFAPVYNLAAADLNGDGKVDIAFSAPFQQNQGVAVALGNGDGTFQAPTLFPTSTQDPSLDSPLPAYVKILDLNGDSHPDLLVTNYEFGTVAVLYGAGNGTFSAPTEFASGNGNFGLVTTDVNSDGAVDIVTARDNSNGVTVLLNAAGSKTQPAFDVAPEVSTATAKPGSPATYNLMLTGRNGYSGTVTFACSGLPARATCSFSPASITAKGNAPFMTVLTIAANSHDSDGDQAQPSYLGQTHSPLLPALGGLGFVALVFAGTRRKRVYVANCLLALVLLGAVAATTACSETPGTRRGTYAVTVTATGTNGPTQTTMLTLVVQ